MNNVVRKLGSQTKGYIDEFTALGDSFVIHANENTIEFTSDSYSMTKGKSNTSWQRLEILTIFYKIEQYSYDELKKILVNTDDNIQINIISELTFEELFEEKHYNSLITGQQKIINTFAILYLEEHCEMVSEDIAKLIKSEYNSGIFSDYRSHFEYLTSNIGNIDNIVTNFVKFRFNTDFCLKEEITNDYIISNDEYLNNFQPKKKTFKNIFMDNGYIFNIPVYQRDYAWGKTQINKYMGDIENVSKGIEHFFGTISFSYKNNASGTSIRIIDGQQRVSSTIIILRAIFDLAKERGEQLPNYVNTFFDRNNENRFKNAANGVSGSLLSKMLSSGEKSIREKVNGNDAKNKIIENYNQAKTYLCTNSSITLMEFAISLLNNIKFIQINFNITMIQELIIFNNLNATGVSLNDLDLFKNSLFCLVNIDSYELNEKKVAEIYEKILRIFSIDKTSKSVKEKSLLEITSILTKTKYSVISKSKVTEYPSLIATKFIGKESDLSLDEFEQLVNEICKVLSIYILAQKSNISALFGNAGMKQFRHTLFALKKGKNHLNPIVNIIYKYAMFDPLTNEIIDIQNKKIISKILYLIEIYNTSESVANYGNSNRSYYEKVFSKINEYPDVEKIYTEVLSITKGEIPPLEKVKTTLQSGTQNDAVNHQVIYRLEVIYSSINKNIDLIPHELELEHIMPQKPVEWIKEAIVDDIEKSDEHKRHLNKIGNTIFLHPKLNGYVSNDVFSKKKIAFTDRPPALLTQTMKHVNDVDVWDYNVINERTTELAKKIISDYQLALDN